MNLSEYEFSLTLRKDRAFLDFINDVTKIINGYTFSRVITAVALSAQTASIAQTVLYTPSVAGLYRVSVYHFCSTAGTAGTLDTTIFWTDDVGATNAKPAAQISLTVAGNWASGQGFLRSNSGSIDYSTTVAGAVGSPQYGSYLCLELIC